ncbi:T9SS type A sorting domain-containing protein [Spirosoma arcticum]
MKRHTVHWLVGLLMFPLLTTAQIQVSFPVSRAVFQRSANNEAKIHINGYYTQSVTRIEARVQARNGQGVSSDWVTIQASPAGGNYAGDLTVAGGWYNLEVRGMNGDQSVGTASVERVGVGEVFIIAGQSNAQGVYDDMPSATDDRVNGLNYYDASESAGDPPTDVLTRFTHLDRGGVIAPRGIGTWCWGRLGDLLAQRLNVPILFFNAGYGGTTIQNWRQSIETGRTENIYISGTYHRDGQPYANLRSTLQFYTHMLGVRAILWHQGEAENYVHTSGSRYGSDLQFVIDRSRQDSGKNIAWVVARASYTSDLRGGRPEIIAAQNQLISSAPNVFPGPATDEIQIPRQRPPRRQETYDDVHFDVDGLVDLANAWNNSLTDAFFARALPQPPVPAPTVSVSCSTTNQLAIAVNGSFSSVSWNTGEAGPTITKGAGTYRATVKDAVGNVLLSPMVRVSDTPTIQASGPTTFCAEGSIQLKASYDNNIIWTTASTGQELTVTTAGDYSVQYQDVSGCRFVSPTVSVRVNPLPPRPTITAAAPTTFCQGESTQLSTDENVAYTWSSGQTSRRIDVRTSGAYTVTVTDQNGCTSPRSSALVVVVNPLPPTPTITTNRSTTFCADQQVTLTATEDQQYQWTSGQTARAVTINQSGQYTLRTQNRFNCLSAPSAPVTVLVNPLPQAPTLTASGRTIFCEGDQVVLTANSPLKPVWITGDSTRTISVRQSGVYTARVEDSNGCFSTASPALPVDVKPVPSVPLLSQTGTYTLEVTGLLPGDYYRWLLDRDTLLIRTATVKASRSGTYSAQSFIIYSPTLTCSSALSNRLDFTVETANQGLSIYPNPSLTKQVSVETLADLTDAVIRVYTLTGQEVATVGVPVFRERQRLDFTTLPNGMYIMQVQAAGFVVAKRILIGVGN